MPRIVKICLGSTVNQIRYIFFSLPAAMSLESTIEFSVNLGGPETVESAKAALKSTTGVTAFTINPKKQIIEVTTTLPTAQVQAAIETKTDLRAVVTGLGAKEEDRGTNLGAAVAAVGGMLGVGAKVQGKERKN